MSRRLNVLNAPRWLQWTVLVFVLLGTASLVVRDWLAPGGVGTTTGATRGDATIRELFEGRRSGELVTIQGKVDRILEDDNRGSRHQRFIVRLQSGTTLLVAHNIDLAERVPLELGSGVQVRGEYEWNDRGGLLHWTHHDPAGRHPGGWIEFDGTRYR